MSIPLINGVAYGWGSVGLVINGNIIRGIKSIEYSVKQDKKNIEGQGYKPVARGYGKYTYEGSIEIMVDELMALRSGLPQGDIMQILPFTIPVVFGDSRTNVNSDQLLGVEFTENPFKAAEGETSLWVKLPLLIADINFGNI